VSAKDLCCVICGSIEGVRRIKQTWTSIPVYLFTSSGSEELAIAAFRSGVSDYFRAESGLRDLISEMLHRAQASTEVTDKRIPPTPSPIVGTSPQILGIREYVRKVASSDSNVLITGETGTGKELIANLIHESSRRARQAMVSVNCAAIPENLIESELFGYERGAFTGAHSSMPGKLEMANNGTIFFDEIADLSPHAQAKLLRVTEGQGFYRLGGQKNIVVNVRILAATNHDLDTLAMEDRFRKDLYFRLNVGRVHLPPLRERQDDIPALLDHYLEKFCQAFGGTARELSPDARRHLLEYSWPGNIRELRNVLESVFVAQPAEKIEFHDLPEWFRKRLATHAVAGETEYDRIISALNSTKWNKSKAADQLEWSRMTLYRKMAKYRLKSA
jgi:DNA-binding NtrC family response regulator